MGEVTDVHLSVVKMVGEVTHTICALTVACALRCAVIHRTLHCSAHERELQPGGRGLELFKEVGEGDSDGLTVLGEKNMVSIGCYPAFLEWDRYFRLVATLLSQITGYYIDKTPLPRLTSALTSTWTTKCFPGIGLKST